MFLDKNIENQFEEVLEYVLKKEKNISLKNKIKVFCEKRTKRSVEVYRGRNLRPSP
jgi:hypothetical protein